MQTYFDLVMSKRHVVKYILKLMQSTFKEFRVDLYKHYCEFEDLAEARQNPPERITNLEDWNLLCDRWETPEWKVF